jgi:phospholipid/cholesterol/gamma-HCH transport system permease protein
LSSVEKYDSFVIILAKILNERFQSDFEILFYDDRMESFFNFFSKEKDHSVKKKKHLGWFERLGNLGIDNWSDIRYFIEFNGNIFLRLLKILTFSSKIRWKDIPYQFLNSGVNAVPIVFLILLLIGLITGYQGAMQLKDFGADNYIAPLVGISITRELSPLMTAILVAGRSGSAFAAEIGTMKVSEELDAIKVLGYDIYNFLIIPRIIAITLAIPLLTLLGDIAGLVGGGIASYTTLDITINSYLNNLQSALSYAHVGSGLFKSIIFGYLIGLVGCFRGTQVGSGADSVGKLTTSSVVTSIFLIIISDALFTYIFRIIGL